MKPNWFVAAPVAAASWLPQVLADLPPECRGFQPEDVHLTIAFFGAMAPERRPAVLEALAAIREQPITITLGRLLALPAPRRVSALSFAVAEGDEAARGLIARHRDALAAAAGARPEHRPPLAHITVARPIRKHGERGRQAARAWARQVAPPAVSLVLDRLALYTWAEDRRVRQFQCTDTVPMHA
jgi:RNA 2',3'-cyclic 3'-phosphodiesterase